MAIITALLVLAGLDAVVAHPPAYPGKGSNGAPSPGSINTDLTILTYNDLLGNSSTRQESVIVLDTKTLQTQAQQACSALGEKLWYPNGNDNFLNYLSYESKSGPYWTAGRQGPKCKSIMSNGKQSTTSCSTRLPALCTNSAPLSNLTYNPNATTWQTMVNSAGQRYTGSRDKHSFRFLGIRYAKQPERFTYSTPLNAAGSYNALDFGSQCYQYGSGSEDCLFLNVWSPYLPTSSKPSPKQLKPVLLWIHGGAFVNGAGSDPTFDGGALASRGDVVVVTINYRLGTLGFLALNDGVIKGNYGLADQITALEWLHTHIAAFGGDANRITIAGQSAGAASVRALLASPKAIGKFAAAIPQSNLAGQVGATTYSQYYSISEEVEVVGNAILNETGCANATSRVNCLCALSGAAISSLADTARYPVVDGTYLVTPQLEVTGRGSVAKVPVLMGFMRDDGATFLPYPETNDTLESFVAVQGFNFTAPLSESALNGNLFPQPMSANTTLNIFNTTGVISTDAQFRCLDLATAYSASKHSVLDDIYFYEFNRSYQLTGYSPNPPTCVPAPDASHPLGDPSKEYFKCHSGELYYVFGSLAFNGLAARDENDIPFEQFSVDTWASFVRTYNPTPDLGYLRARGFTNTIRELQTGRGKWKPYTDDQRTLRVLQWPSFETNEYVFASEAQCDALGLPIDYYETTFG